MSIQSQCPKSCVAIDTTLLTTLSHRISSYPTSYLQRQLLPNTHTHPALAFLTWPRNRTPTTDPIRCLLLCHWRKELSQRDHRVTFLIIALRTHNIIIIVVERKAQSQCTYEWGARKSPLRHVTHHVSEKILPQGALESLERKKSVQLNWPCDYLQIG